MLIAIVRWSGVTKRSVEQAVQLHARGIDAKSFRETTWVIRPGFLRSLATSIISVRYVEIFVHSLHN